MTWSSMDGQPRITAWIRRALPLLLVASLATAFDAREGQARCSWVHSYPRAIGPHTFLLARATPDSVTLTVSPPLVPFRAREIPAQVMQVDEVGGLDSDALRAALAVSDARAVFVRFSRAPSCAQVAMLDGGFDRPGTRGLYIATPRTREAWIGGRPTFDVFDAPFLPLPDFHGGRARQGLPRPSSESRLTLSADELFDLYTSIWSESAPPGDPDVSRRARTWIARNPDAIMKVPAREIITSAAADLSESAAARRVRPFGGTFTLTVRAPGMDTLVLHARTVALPWTTGARGERRSPGDSIATGPGGSAGSGIEWSLQLATTANAFRPTRPTQACGEALLVVQEGAVSAVSRSTLRATTTLSSIGRCGWGTALADLFSARGPAAAPDSLELTFRIVGEGRVTVDGVARRDGGIIATLRGERTSEVVGRAALPE